MEKVQKKAIKTVLEVRELTHRERPAAMGVPTLEDRRRHMTTYNFLNRSKEIDIEQCFKAGNNRTTRGHNRTLNKKRY